MPNSARKIIRGVRIGGTTYVQGKEDELDALLTAAEVKRLSEKGYIEGAWSGAAAEPKVEEKTAKPDKKDTK